MLPADAGLSNGEHAAARASYPSVVAAIAVAIADLAAAGGWLGLTLGPAQD